MFFEVLARSGLMMARCRSTAMAVSVKTDTLTLISWTNGQNGHMNSGRFQRCSSAAWNWKGMANTPMVTSASARLAMNMFVIVCICLVVRTIQMTSEFPMTASRLMVP
uniref:Uncharacterized protein n=1 Tax=Anopheles darlingi TaxID=43151 RepID=A0A2M4D4H8_ANODA